MIIKRILITSILMCLVTFSSFTATKSSMSVTVKKTQVRTSPSFLGKIIYILSYTDRVNVYDQRAGWFYIGVDNQSERGWVHSSALTEKKLTLKASSGRVGSTASSNEVALAGKGFNSQVEAEYRNQNDLDYSWIDKMETYNFEIDEVILFLNEAGIYPMEVN